MTFWPPGQMRSYDKMKYFFFQKSYGYQTMITWSQEITRQIENLISPLLQGLYYQTWQRGDVYCQEITYGVALFFDYAVLWVHMKNLKQKFKFICEN